MTNMILTNQGSLMLDGKKEKPLYINKPLKSFVLTITMCFKNQVNINTLNIFSDIS